MLTLFLCGDVMDARWLASTLTDAAEAFSSCQDADSDDRLVLRGPLR